VSSNNLGSSLPPGYCSGFCLYKVLRVLLKKLLPCGDSTKTDNKASPVGSLFFKLFKLILAASN